MKCDASHTLHIKPRNPHFPSLSYETPMVKIAKPKMLVTHKTGIFKHLKNKNPRGKILSLVSLINHKSFLTSAYYTNTNDDKLL